MFCRKVFFQLQRAGYSTKATIQKKAWTQKETDLLTSLVAKHGKHWSMLSMFFEGRSPNKLSSRYFYVEQKKLKELRAKKSWSKEEDELLLFKVDKIGFDWEKIIKEFQEQRTKEELSDRFLTLTKHSQYNHGIWSKTESHKLNRLVKLYGKDWSNISNELGTRSAQQCYTRWWKSTQYVANPDGTLALKAKDAEDVINAVKTHGLDFKFIKEKLGLSRISPDNLEQIYRTQLDPAICRDPWTEDELYLLVELYRELDGSMKLVQTCLPKKRSLQDLWDQYYKATQNI